ncbi:MAG: glycosyltransferase family 4 protein [Ignavibacteria bacterium]|nr:glycosyltransferase family 4 protein [Ignavibacteria bacterium]
MKIVYLTSESYIDHSYTVCRELEKHIEIRVYLQAKEETAEIESWCKKIGAEFVKRRRFKNPLSFIGEIIFLLRIRKMKADVVWFNTLTIYQAFLVNILLKKFMIVMHDVDIHPETRDRHGLLSAKITIKLALKNICAASQTQAEIFQKQHGFYPPVFQLPIIDYYKECGEEAGETAGRDMVQFFFFGSVEKYKGIEILLEAAEILQEKHLEFGLKIYGRLKYDSQEISGRIHALKNTVLINEFIDYRRIHSIYCQNDILVLPYRQVTQCGPLLIGYSEGVPAICSSLDGFREYVDDGIDSLLFDNTPGGLASRMEEIIRDKSIIKKLSKGIEVNTMKKFSMAALTDMYLANFNKCMNS